MKRSAFTYRGLFAAITLSVIAACSSIAPKSFDQALAEAYATHTAVIEATTTALNAGTISVDEARQVQTQALDSRQVLDTARAAELRGNDAAAQSDLVMATRALSVLQGYLNARAAR